ncbi:MAG: FGGY family carbohydrate kinase, partial [Saprospiraceae bacterium]
MDYLISIDIGTSSTRSIAFSTAGKVLASESVALSIESRQPGWQEQDAERIFQAVLKTL